MLSNRLEYTELINPTIELFNDKNKALLFQNEMNNKNPNPECYDNKLIEIKTNIVNKETIIDKIFDKLDCEGEINGTVYLY